MPKSIFIFTLLFKILSKSGVFFRSNILHTECDFDTMVYEKIPTLTIFYLIRVKSHKPTNKIILTQQL